MTYDRQPPHDCPRATDNPAQQPKPPSDGTTCTERPPSPPPLLDPPGSYDLDPYCTCPTKPVTNPNGLEELITGQAAEIANREKSAQLKGELEELLKQARAASQAYTRSKYDDMLKAWIEQDVIVAQLIARLVCVAPCWRCVIECHVCPLLNQLFWAKSRLYDDQLYADVHNLYDLQYWHTRDKQIKDRRLACIEKVLIAWTAPGPAVTIEATLKANKDLAAAISGVLGTDPSKEIYDLFFRLIPRHLAIAPPAAVATTKIDQEYTVFCTGDPGEADDCCGPDVGELTLRQRLVGPLPDLIDPTDYFNLICCIVDRRFHPAREAARKAETDLTALTTRIASLVEQIGPAWPTTFETDAKGAIPSVIDCSDYHPREGGS